MLRSSQSNQSSFIHLFSSVPNNKVAILALGLETGCEVVLPPAHRRNGTYAIRCRPVNSPKNTGQRVRVRDRAGVKV